MILNLKNNEMLTRKILKNSSIKVNLKGYNTILLNGMYTDSLTTEKLLSLGFILWTAYETIDSKGHKYYVNKWVRSKP